MRFLTAILLLAALRLQAQSPPADATSDDGRSVAARQVIESLLKRGATPQYPDSVPVKLSYGYTVKRRNPLLVFVPMMYTMAYGPRQRSAEAVGGRLYDDSRMPYFRVAQDCDTFPYRRRTRRISDYLHPQLYNENLYPDGILSPLAPGNMKYYRYTLWPPAEEIAGPAAPSQVALFYSPRFDSEQLVRGVAYIDYPSAKLRRARFNAKGDMVDLAVDSYGEDSCRVDARLKMAGCNVATYEQWQRFTKADSLLPAIYYSPFEKTHSGVNPLAEAFKREPRQPRFSVSLSEPMVYYSGTRGLSWRQMVRFYYRPRRNRLLSFRPRIGHYFKIHRWFVQAPLRFEFNVRHGGWVELEGTTGNRITNSSVLALIKDERRDTVNFDGLGLDYFNDMRWRLQTGYRFSRRLRYSAGLEFHQRTAVEKERMIAAGQPVRYRSFSPRLGIFYNVWRDGPLLSLMYERSFTGVLQSNMSYERFEADLSGVRQLHHNKLLNWRAGAGIYSHQKTVYFVDFENFHANYLTDVTDDEFSGDFALLRSGWYNSSRHYVRVNASYETPFLLLARIPFLGRYVRKEMLYGGAALLEHSRPYTEYGYGFKSKYMSVAWFCGFVNATVYETGFRFSCELFRKW